MKEVTLLGTSHEIQRGERLEEEFKDLLVNQFKNNDFLSIAEEIDNKKSYIAKGICLEKGIEYLIVEPTPEEKRVLGIPLEEDIVYGISQSHYEMLEEIEVWPSDPSAITLPEEVWLEYSNQMQSSYTKREKEWLKRLTKMDKWPSLFICGAEHFKPFKELLESSGITVKALYAYWDPEKNTK